MSQLKIIQTSDIHSYMFRDDYIVKGNTKDQGLLHFSSYIKKQQEEYDVLLLDTGDLFQGSPLSFYVANNLDNYTKHPITDSLNYLKYDIVTPGNHEFNYGFTYLKKCFNDLEAQIVVANIEGLDKNLNIKPYVIKDIGDLKVAIIGFTTAAVPNFEKSENIEGLNFLPIVDTYKKYEQELLNNSDLIIVNYHGGFEEDLNTFDINDDIAYDLENEGISLLKNFSSIDLLLTGHQHLEICKKVNNTLVMQPGVNGHKISEVTIKDGQISGQLITSNSSTTPDIASLNKVQTAVQNYLDICLGKSEEDLIIEDLFDARLNSHPLINFINQVQLDYTKADISAMSLFDNSLGFKKDITMRQILANYPFPNEVVVLDITLEDLKEALEVSASYFLVEDGQIKINPRFTKPKLEHYQYDMFGGLKYEFDLNKPIGKRISKIELPEDIDKEHIKIALNSYRSTNYNWYPMYKEKKVLFRSSEDMISILVNYIKDKKEISVDKTKTFKVNY